jgi:hypothetical protein
MATLFFRHVPIMTGDVDEVKEARRSNGAPDRN